MRDVLLAGFLGINAGQQKPRFLWELDPAELENLPIAVARHCFGCTAGAGSSYGEALT
jgi:hypothetical protein